MSDPPNDKEQLIPTLEAVSPVIKAIANLLVDSGFYREAAVAQAEQKRDGANAPTICAATGRYPHGCSVERLVQHRNFAKWKLDSNKHIVGFRLEKECFGFIEGLRARWVPGAPRRVRSGMRQRRMRRC